MRSLLAIVLVAGCEHGTEIAGVSQATVTQGPDGVVVTATLGCMLASGMGRADGNCDADDTGVCVEAEWFSGSDPKPGEVSVTSKKTCQRVAHVRNATIQITFAKLPDSARTVRVFTSDQDRAKDAALKRGVTASR